MTCPRSLTRTTSSASGWRSARSVYGSPQRRLVVQPHLRPTRPAPGRWRAAPAGPTARVSGPVSHFERARRGAAAAALGRRRSHRGHDARPPLPRSKGKPESTPRSRSCGRGAGPGSAGPRRHGAPWSPAAQNSSYGSVRIAALASSSACSAAGSEPHVMPPPVPNSALPVVRSTVTVRMATLNRARKDCPGGRHDADRSAVDAPRLGLEFSDELHGPVLRGAGHRARREQRPEDVDQPGAGSRSCGDVGGQLPHRLVALRGEQGGHVHAPTSAIRPRSLRSRSTIMRFSARSFSLPTSARAPLGVLGRGRPRRGGALHRPGAAGGRRPVEEQLGARAGHDVAAEVEVGRVRAALGPGEVGVQLLQVARTPRSASGRSG